MTTLESLESKKQKLSDIEKTTIQAEERRRGYLSTWQETKAQLIKLGVPEPITEESIQAYIKKEEELINQKIEKLNEVLSDDILNGLSKKSIEDIENEKILSEIDMNQEF